MYNEQFLPGQEKQNRRSDDATVLLIAHKLNDLHEDVGAMREVLKELTSAITKLALIEERQSQAALAQERALKVLEKLEGRVEKLEKDAPVLKLTSDGILKIAALGITAIATALLVQVGLK